MRLGFPTLLALISTASQAAAERGHVRRSLGGTLGLVRLDRGGATGEAMALGGDLRFSFGVRDDLELGASGSFLVVRDAVFRGAVVDDLPGDLHANVYAPSLTLDARWIPGVDYLTLFARTKPFLGVSAGATAPILTSQVHLSGSESELARPGTSIELVPFVAITAGIEHRISRRVTLGLAASAEVGTRSWNHLALHLELSWVTF